MTRTPRRKLRSTTQSVRTRFVAAAESLQYLSRALAPLLIFVIGRGMYFGSDLLVTGFLDPDQVVEWAEFRSVIGLAGLFCLVGLDQVLIRSPQSSARILSVLAFQVPLLAVPVSIVLAKLEFVRSPSVAFLLALGSAGTIALFHYYRTNRLMIMAQLAQQGWVVVAFFAIVAYVVRDLKAPMMPLLVTI